MFLLFPHLLMETVYKVLFTLLRVSGVTHTPSSILPSLRFPLLQRNALHLRVLFATFDFLNIESTSRNKNPHNHALDSGQVHRKNITCYVHKSASHEKKGMKAFSYRQR